MVNGAGTVFIEVAEQSGLIENLGRNVLEKACADAARWQGKGDHKKESPAPDDEAQVASALEAVGISVDPELFQAADFTMQGGYNAAKQLLGNPRKRPAYADKPRPGQSRER